MDDKQFQKRISETVVDIYPLDRLLPIETVYSIFEREYARTDNKNVFFRERKFQRLREGYFSLFAAISLTDTSNKNHYLMFPGNPSNDVHICYCKNKSKSEFVGYEFDIKEFTSFSDSFTGFIKKKIVPKVDIYNLIIATYRKIDGKDLRYLIDCLKFKDSDIKVWLVGNPFEENNDKDISKVTIIDKDRILYDKTINLNEWLDRRKPEIIYQDTIRFK
ncbi:MAG: hypothetical protein JRJ00_03800 [Deltaproteobacteria bacterium]|nr:hypothetical protein [Deltaproteobacteria bacterium]